MRSLYVAIGLAVGMFIGMRCKGKIATADVANTQDDRAPNGAGSASEGPGA
jgi:hypothetical protein